MVISYGEEYIFIIYKCLKKEKLNYQFMVPAVQNFPKNLGMQVLNIYPFF
jgi:hypothetical protein